MENEGKGAFESVIDEVALFDFKDLREWPSRSFGPLFSLWGGKAKPVTCLSSHWKPTPAVANKNITTMLLSLSLEQHVKGYFSPLPTFSAFFCSFFGICFIGWLELYPEPWSLQEKEARILSLAFFCEAVRAGNLYGCSYQRSHKLSFTTLKFWRFPLWWLWGMWNTVA